MDCENFEDDRGLRPPCSRISAGWYPAYQSDLVVVSSSVAFIYDHLRDAVIAMSLSAPACNCSVFSTTTLEWRKSWTRSIGCWMEESRFLRLGLSQEINRIRLGKTDRAKHEPESVLPSQGKIQALASAPKTSRNSRLELWSRGPVRVECAPTS